MHRGEAVEDVVIVGAGLAGLATALGLHRYGNTHMFICWYPRACLVAAPIRTSLDPLENPIPGFGNSCAAQERGEEPGPGVVAGAADGGVRVHGV